MHYNVWQCMVNLKHIYHTLIYKSLIYFNIILFLAETNYSLIFTILSRYIISADINLAYLNIVRPLHVTRLCTRKKIEQYGGFTRLWSVTSVLHSERPTRSL